MDYYTDLFSPETYEAFTQSDRTITGFKASQRSRAQRIKPGDVFVCYMTKLSRWVGLLEATSSMFEDDTPVFLPKDDPYTIRFNVRVIVWLEPEYGYPIRDDSLWSKLSFTREHDKGSSSWTGQLRSSLKNLDEKDAIIIRNSLESQNQNSRKSFPISVEQRRKLISPLVHVTPDRKHPVSIPNRDEESSEHVSQVRESIRIQAMLASIGERLRLDVWIPKADRSKVLDLWMPKKNRILDALPLNYDEATLKTVEQIDVLWLRRRTIVRAFEVEHTTSVYSGILRMADLLALQPNLRIKAHIVAPDERRGKVIQEITRPVFTLLEGGPLAQVCTYIAYESISYLDSQKHLGHMTDSIVDEYSEEAESLDI